MFITPVEIWLIIGVILILIEFFQVPGIGFLFLGLGAISNSIIIKYYPDISYYQFGIFGLISLIWFIILWRPMKFFLKNNSPNRGYFDIIGSEVEVVNNNVKVGNIIQVRWSGAIMNAKLLDKESSTNIGDILYVHKVKGNILICSDKPPTDIK